MQCAKADRAVIAGVLMDIWMERGTVEGMFLAGEGSVAARIDIGHKAGNRTYMRIYAEGNLAALLDYEIERSNYIMVYYIEEGRTK